MNRVGRKGQKGGMNREGKERTGRRNEWVTGAESINRSSWVEGNPLGYGKLGVNS